MRRGSVINQRWMKDSGGTGAEEGYQSDEQEQKPTRKCWKCNLKLVGDVPGG